MAPTLHEYMGGTIAGLGGVAEAVGGVADHVHLLIGLRATHTLADVVRELKKAATGWIHDERLEHLFCWQDGYAAFTVSPTARAAVKNYIAHQEDHHRQKDYLAELKTLLEAAEIEYDPRCLD